MLSVRSLAAIGSGSTATFRSAPLNWSVSLSPTSSKLVLLRDSSTHLMPPFAKSNLGSKSNSLTLIHPGLLSVY